MNFDIDLVYTWCDGNDPAFRARKVQYGGNIPADNEDAGVARFFSNDELRYSLRSVMRYAPWIRHIFVVTDRQRPAWIDTSGGCISIVDHSEFIPAEYIPTFNSSGIEVWLHRIPGLSEHFLYANDDMFFGRPLQPGFFFDPSGRPVVRLKHQKLGPGRGTYQTKVRNMQLEIGHRFGKKYTLAPHHNIDAYRRSLYEECMGYYSDWVAETAAHRFRSSKDLQRSIVGYYMLATGEASFVKNSRYGGTSSLWQRARCFLTDRYSSNSRCMPLAHTDFHRAMRKYGPAPFALNDDNRTTDEDRKRVRRFLEQLFPTPSPFEKTPERAGGTS